jgi:uncharacterized phage-associated protein
MAAHSVIGIANEFISRAEANGKRITPMQLQKLCYMAHGYSLAILNGPLTSDEIQAWDFGPVYPVLYDALKRYGSNAVPALLSRNNWAVMDHVRGDVVRVTLSGEQTELVNSIYETYGDFQGFQLSALTHEAGSPWEKVYKPGKKMLVIPDALIREYFVGLAQEAA